MAETLGRRAFLAGAGALAAAPLLPALPVGAGEVAPLTKAAVDEAMLALSAADFGGDVYVLSQSGFHVWRNAWTMTALQRIMANAPTETAPDSYVSEWDETPREYYDDEYD